MIILDTNVISAIMREFPDPRVVAWLDRQPRSSLWTTSVTSLEIQYGLQILPLGKRRTALLGAFRIILDRIANRVLPFDAPAADHASTLMANRQRAGRPVELRDTMIAGIALAQNAALATRNTVHFTDLTVPLIDPWSP
ncbi:MAG TPA: type II toxin-antitoxin system VapC family toxin [Terriglobales bacterium]